MYHTKLVGARSDTRFESAPQVVSDPRQFRNFLVNTLGCGRAHVQRDNVLSRDTQTSRALKGCMTALPKYSTAQCKICVHATTARDEHASILRITLTHFKQKHVRVGHSSPEQERCFALSRTQNKHVGEQSLILKWLAPARSRRCPAALANAAGQPCVFPEEKSRARVRLVEAGCCSANRVRFLISICASDQEQPFCATSSTSLKGDCNSADRQSDILSEMPQPSGRKQALARALTPPPPCRSAQLA